MDNIDSIPEDHLSSDSMDEKPKNEAPGGMSPILVIFLITGLMGLVAAITMLLSEQQPNTELSTIEQISTAPRADWEAPAFTTQTLNGDTVSLADYRGRIVFLNFWRTDCGPCVYELPAFQNFTQAQGEDGAIILALNVGENAEQIGSFLDDLGINQLTVLLNEDASYQTLYSVGGLPTTFVIDETGIVRYFKLGAMTEEEMNGYVDVLTTGETEAQG